MTDQISFPPLDDLSPMELEARKQHLLSEINRVPPQTLWHTVRLRPRHGWERRPLIAVAAALTAVIAASLVGVFAFGGSAVRQTTPPNPTSSGQNDGGSGRLGSSWEPSVARPLPPGAQQVQLSDASSMLGGQLALPNSSLVTGSGAGPIWANTLHDPEPGGLTQTTIAVTFPQQGVIVEYQRPASFPDPAAHYKGVVQQQPGSQLLDLNGVTGLGIDQNVDGQENFGVIDFVTGGTRVVVLGHYDQPTLRGIALSILSN